MAVTIVVVAVLVPRASQTSSKHNATTSYTCVLVLVLVVVTNLIGSSTTALSTSGSSSSRIISYIRNNVTPNATESVKKMHAKYYDQTTITIQMRMMYYVHLYTNSKFNTVKKKNMEWDMSLTHSQIYSISYEISMTYVHTNLEHFINWSSPEIEGTFT